MVGMAEVSARQQDGGNPTQKEKEKEVFGRWKRVLFLKSRTHLTHKHWHTHAPHTTAHNTRLGNNPGFLRKSALCSQDRWAAEKVLMRKKFLTQIKKKNTRKTRRTLSSVSTHGTKHTNLLLRFGCRIKHTHTHRFVFEILFRWTRCQTLFFI